MTGFIRFAAVVLFAACACIGTASAADYPVRSVKWVVPYPPAGTTDVLARIIAQWLSEKMGQQFVIENKPGAANNIGVEAVVNAPADGYTMLLVNPANGINASLYKKLPFNFIRDIAPVAGSVRTPNVMAVSNSLPAKNVAEFIAYCKSLEAFEQVLRRMAGLDDGIVDALFTFSRPVTGGYYWCPPVKSGRLDLSFVGL